MQYEIIKKDNSRCYFCLEDIDYYIKFNCNCHNYLHTRCLENEFFTNCLICKKKINKKNFIHIDNLTITNFVVDKLNVKNYLKKLQNNTLMSKNCLMLILYFVACILFVFIILIPCLFVDFILEKNKKFTFNGTF